MATDHVLLWKERAERVGWVRAGGQALYHVALVREGREEQLKKT